MYSCLCTGYAGGLAQCSSFVNCSEGLITSIFFLRKVLLTLVQALTLKWYQQIDAALGFYSLGSRRTQSFCLKKFVTFVRSSQRFLLRRLFAFLVLRRPQKLRSRQSKNGFFSLARAMTSAIIRESLTIRMHYLISTMLALLIAGCWSTARVWPLPTVTFTQGKTARSLKPSDLTLQSKCSDQHVKQLFDIYKTYYGLGGPVTVSVEIGNCQLVPAKDNEEYIVLLDNSTISVVAEHYPGAVRGIETLFQLFEGQEGRSFVMVPTVVRDRPAFSYRGIMLDTSRHFISLPVIKQAIDGCMANKLNIFHWHLVDDDSFPLGFGGASNKSTFEGRSYSREQIKDIVRYAMVRGVRVVPEIDTPSHTGSWGAAFNSSSMVVMCGSIFGQFDPTLNQTYDTMLKVMREAIQLFPDEYLHLGGDQVNQACWDKAPAIKKFMAANNISDYNALQVYYRKRQKKMLRTITNKTLLYWGNTLKQLDWFEEDDVLHWWDGIGSSDASNGTAERAAKKVVLSYFDKSYLNTGFEGSSVMTWRRLYENRWGFPWSKAAVLGGVAALWSEINNDYTTSVKLWMRSAALAQRLWNPSLFKQNSTNYNDILNRLSAQSTRMKQRGFKVAPLTDQLCQGNASYCFKIPTQTDK